eukprot:scaffold158148_cov30-Tisochrysis_lutea.AAC.5
MDALSLIGHAKIASFAPTVIQSTAPMRVHLGYHRSYLRQIDVARRRTCRIKKTLRCMRPEVLYIINVLRGRARSVWLIPNPSAFIARAPTTRADRGWHGHNLMRHVRSHPLALGSGRMIHLGFFLA